MTDTTEAPPSVETHETAKIKVVALWLSDAARMRLAERLEAEVSTDIDDLDDTTDLVLVSTRLPKVRMHSVMSRLSEAGDTRIVVLCHAGGEEVAINLIALGARGVIAEGNESALTTTFPDAALTMRPADENGLVATLEPVDPQLLLTGFRQRLEFSRDQADVSAEDATGLRTESDLKRVLSEHARRAQLPRLGYIKFANASTVLEAVDPTTVNLVAQRMSVLMIGACARYGASLYGLGPLCYAFVGETLDANDADELADQLVTIGASFRPDGVEALRVGVGHAGPDVADNDRTLLDIAERAASTACRQGGGTVNAGRLSTEEAVDTELNAAFAAMHRLDSPSEAPSHGELTAEFAVPLARELGYDQLDLVRIRLAAILHDIGKIGLPTELHHMEGSELSGEDQEMWRAHPRLGAEYVRLSGGAELASAVLHHHERWDGSGFPDGLSGEDIPLDARILAVADRAAKEAVGDEPADTAIMSGAGTEFDPTVADAFAAISSHPDA